MEKSNIIWTTLNWEATYPILEYHLLIPIRCADARDVGRLENEVTRRLIAEYAARGILVDFRRIVRAGSIVNRYSLPEIKSVLKEGLARAIDQVGVEHLDPIGSGKEAKVPFIPVIQISGHAEVKTTAAPKLVYAPGEIILDDAHSIVNCGMAHASEVWKYVVDWLIKQKPTIEFYDKTIRKRVKLAITNLETVQRLLVSVYTHDGQTPYDFLKSIDLLQEPLKSKAYLREALNHDNDLAAIAIHINAGLRNFITGSEYRIDANTHVHTLLDDKAAIMEFIMKKLPPTHPERERRGSKQKPIVGLICAPNVHYPRETLVEYLRLREGRKNLDVAGSVFLAIGPNVVEPFSTFGPYKLGGILYSVINLNIKEYYILGRDESEIANIHQKIRNDPVLSLVFDKFSVKIKSITLDKMRAEGVLHDPTPIFDQELDKLINDGIKHVLKLSSHKNSPLHRFVVSPQVQQVLSHGEMH